MPFGIATALADVFTDLQFGLFLLETKSIDPVLGYICLGSLGFAVFACVVTSVLVQRTLFNDLPFLNWLVKHRTSYLISAVLSLFNPYLFGLCASQLFNKKLWSAPIPKNTWNHLHATGLVPRVLEDVPQLFLQVVVVLQLKALGRVAGLSLFVTTLHICTSVLSRWVMRITSQHERTRSARLVIALELESSQIRSPPERSIVRQGSDLESSSVQPEFDGNPMNQDDVELSQVRPTSPTSAEQQVQLLKAHNAEQRDEIVRQQEEIEKLKRLMLSMDQQQKKE